MAADNRDLERKSTEAEVAAFLRQAASAPKAQVGGQVGRLLFALDATASRQPTWDRATHIQARMFEQAVRLGGLEIQLAYYRGYREFFASRWLRQSSELLNLMTSVSCRGGLTQIERLLAHAAKASGECKLNAVVFVGDCVEENIDRICHRAGELGIQGSPVFVFQEGRDAKAERAFREVAKLSRGAYCRFDADSADQLRDLLTAVAVYASGGPRALEDHSRRAGSLVRQLTHQVSGR